MGPPGPACAGLEEAPGLPSAELVRVWGLVHVLLRILEATGTGSHPVLCWCGCWVWPQARLQTQGTVLDSRFAAGGCQVAAPDGFSSDVPLWPKDVPQVFHTLHHPCSECSVINSSSGMELISPCPGYTLAQPGCSMPHVIDSCSGMEMKLSRLGNASGQSCCEGSVDNPSGVLQVPFVTQVPQGLQMLSNVINSCSGMELKLSSPGNALDQSCSEGSVDNPSGVLPVPSVTRYPRDCKCCPMSSIPAAVWS